MSKRLIILMALLLPLLPACSKLGENETAETANILLPYQDVPYKFSRNGISSVDYYQVELLAKDYEHLERQIANGSIELDASYQNFLRIYRDGLNSLSLEEQVASSPAANAQRERAYIQEHIEASRKIQKNKLAQVGEAGYLDALTVGASGKSYVDQNGLLYSRVFASMLIGAVYLDKVLHLHLDKALYQRDDLRASHLNLIPEGGANYTTLEHHWDLAYGFYRQIRYLTDASGQPQLQGVARELENAFVYGRHCLELHDYDSLLEQITLIRGLLSKAYAVQLLERLVGLTVSINYKENPPQAFSALSEAYGMLYGLQFTARPDGSPYFTRGEAMDLMAQLIARRGFWDDLRLSDDETREGSRKWIAKAVRDRFNLK